MDQLYFNFSENFANVAFKRFDSEFASFLMLSNTFQLELKFLRNFCHQSSPRQKPEISHAFFTHILQYSHFTPVVNRSRFPIKPNNF